MSFGIVCEADRMWYNVPRLDNDTADVHCILISFVNKEARAVAGFGQALMSVSVIRSDFGRPVDFSCSMASPTLVA